MPIHDWTRVDAGTFHGFHTAWITHLSEAMNHGILPPGYYAMPEQHLGRSIGDVLTLHTGTGSDGASPSTGGLALADAPPRVTRKFTVTASPRSLRRTLAVRSVSGHQIVALVEIVSPANKDRARHVDDFATKVAAALASGIHVLMVDLFAPGSHDPFGMHGAVWQQLNEDVKADDLPVASRATLAGYVAGADVEVYVENPSVGEPMPDMPLFLNPDRYVNVPLEATYDSAFQGLPDVWRGVLEGRGA